MSEADLGNSYLAAVTRNLPRVLGLFDSDRTSTSHGFGDRFFWAWGLKDFGNGTFQGAVNGLARLWVGGLWPWATSPAVFHSRLDAIALATARLTRPDGSLEEAFPNEGSYCVTALVAFDLLVAMDLLEISGERERQWLGVIAPLIRYLVKGDESHAMISNHLATAVAALRRWDARAGDAEAHRKGDVLLARILDRQSDEGWFEEYGGADPGYQSLCTYYLADVASVSGSPELTTAVGRSLVYLSHFAHPDGSFGGCYGSRNTRFVYPAGFEYFSRTLPIARSLAAHVRKSVSDATVVTLDSIDESNLIPTFNAYCWAATMVASSSSLEAAVEPLPCVAEPFRTVFGEAGLLVDRGRSHYTIIGVGKGGVVAHFEDGRPALFDHGVVITDGHGRFGSTQVGGQLVEYEMAPEGVTVRAKFALMPKQLPGPVRFLILRALSVTAFRVGPVREWVKKWLVHLLITRHSVLAGGNVRRITLGRSISIVDESICGKGWSLVQDPGPFVPIHMASKGYWQLQDEDS